MVKFFEGLPLFPSKTVLTPATLALKERVHAHPCLSYGRLIVCTAQRVLADPARLEDEAAR
jgi:hypothetical protein